MNEKQHQNLGIVLRYGAMTQPEQERFVQAQRDRLAKMFREARIRVKANKARNGGIYTA